jgi:S1-C subfamily serine protease
VDAPDGGVTVRSIEPRSAADQARLRAGDRIEGANGRNVANLDELRDVAKRGGTMVLTVRRGNAVVLLPLRVP